MDGPIKVAIVTVSDRCSAGQRRDLSGPALKKLMEENEGQLYEVVHFSCVPDEREQICTELYKLCDYQRSCHVVITIGGTGFAPRDVTPEATREVIEKEANCLVIALTVGGLPKSAMSRLTAGVKNDTLIINFPGSLDAIKTYWAILQPLLPHIKDNICQNVTKLQHFHGEIAKD